MRIRACICGSGRDSREQYDARGIYLTRTCTACHKEKMRGYRAEVLTDSDYECDEAIDED